MPCSTTAKKRYWTQQPSWRRKVARGRSKVQIASYSAITGVVYGIGALASHGVGVEVSGAGVWWVPCVFKGVKKDGQEFAHALGKAAGLRLLGAPENGSWEIAYGK